MSSDPANDFANMIMDMHQWNVEASIRLAQHQGLRAGVRPNTHPPTPEDEGFPPIKRVVFIEFSEKTMEWGVPETDKNTPWLDSLPQYDQ